MARIRKDLERNSLLNRIIWRIGLYIRLSREDGHVVSESVVNQEKILNDELPSFFDDGMYEIIDTYIDDGTSGTTDVEREDFQRMVRDVKSGRINCIIVKNLSRAFRNSANQGHFLEEFIPLYHTRFISLYQPRIDTFLDPEVVHSLEVSITGFMNEQYAYKTSCDVRRTFKHKRENGEFVGAFAPYGYAKDPKDKNSLIIDEEAAQVVRDIFTWFVKEGMSKAGIVKRLNEQGVPNPTAYKRSKGFRYSNPYTDQLDGLWNATTVSTMLQNKLYIGYLQQGKQRIISYKVHKEVNVPRDEWTVIEDAVPPIIETSLFETAQSLHKKDTRTAPGQREVYLLAGLVRCPDCGKGMQRTVSKNHVYYVCRTYREKSKTACTRHSIRCDALESAILASIQKQIDLVISLSDIIAEINKAPVAKKESTRLTTLLKQKRKELDKASDLLDGIYYDWKSGDITHDQYRRMKVKLEEQVSLLRETVSHIESECSVMEKGIGNEDPYLTTFLKYRNIQSLSRSLLVELVNVVYVHDDGSVEIQFNFADQYRRIVEFIENNRNDLYVIGGNVV